MIAAYGTSTIMKELLTFFSRYKYNSHTVNNNTQVRNLLSIRDSYHRNCLDMALLHGNVGVVKILLKRVGHLCFQNTVINKGMHFVLHCESNHIYNIYDILNLNYYLLSLSYNTFCSSFTRIILAEMLKLFYMYMYMYIHNIL
jgi:hypothetical protein